MINKVLKYLGLKREMECKAECLEKLIKSEKEHEKKLSVFIEFNQSLESKIKTLQNENLKLKCTNGHRYKKISELLLEIKELKSELKEKECFPLSSRLAWSMIK